MKNTAISPIILTEGLQGRLIFSFVLPAGESAPTLRGAVSVHGQRVAMLAGNTNELIIPAIPAGVHLAEVRAGSACVLYGHVEVLPSPLGNEDGEKAYTLDVDLTADLLHVEINLAVGQPGEKGNTGASAYELAVDSGYPGTQEEWLASLRGPSAYDCAVEEGYRDDRATWLDSLKGPKGEKGDAAALDTELMDEWMRSVQYPSTDVGTDNAEFAWFVLASTWTRYGKLMGIGIMCRDTESPTMTTEPRYLGIWEQGETEEDWVPMGVSTNAVSQTVGQKTEWAFEGLKLTGKPIRLCLMMTATQSWEETHRFAARVTIGATCGTQAFANGTLYDWLPQMTLAFAAPADSIADAATLQEHIHDTTIHITEAERAKLAALSGESSGSSSSGESSGSSSVDLTEINEHIANTDIHVTDAERDAISTICSFGPHFNSASGLWFGSADSVGVGSVAFGIVSWAMGENSATFGTSCFAAGNNAAAFGCAARANKHGSTALGMGAQVYADGSASIGFSAINYDAATMLLHACTFGDDGGVQYSTRFFLIGHGSDMATVYCGGEAGLGYITTKRELSPSGLPETSIIARGTRKLSELLTDNTDSFEPATSATSTDDSKATSTTVGTA